MILEKKELPSEVLTKTKKGKIEVRSLIDSGRFVRYEYLDVETGKKTENKVKLVLLTKKGEEEFFIISMGKRYLMLPTEAKGERKLWDAANEKVVELSEL